MNCIKSFAQEVPEGHTILKEPVSRIFPKDDSEACSLGQEVQPLEYVIQEALQTHFKGLKFRERNAGKSKLFYLDGRGAGSRYFFLTRGCLIIIWTGLNIKIGIVQKVYE